LDALKALPIADIASDNAALFLWATPPLLPDALELMAAWGFEYKTIAFTWVKQTRRGQAWHWGMGNWTRANAEHVLLGTRGRPQRLSAAVHSLVVAPIGAHSAKPPEVRDRIVALMGDRPRLELFARSSSPGWVTTGFDADGRDIREAIVLLKED